MRLNHSQATYSSIDMKTFSRTCFSGKSLQYRQIDSPHSLKVEEFSKSSEGRENGYIDFGEVAITLHIQVVLTATLSTAFNA
jgi:hypothetical protein